MPEPQELSDAQYKEYITGSPAGIQYRVHDPVTDLSYDFDGFAAGHLIWTIADYARQFEAVGPLHGGIDGAYIDSARLQLAVRQGYPVRWCVQKAADAVWLTTVLHDAGFAAIDVRHEPAS